MDKPRSYREALEMLQTPPDLPKIIICQNCGEPMYWKQINPQVGFWIHHGKSIQICGEKNILNKGHPFIRQNMNVYKEIKNLWATLGGK